MAKAKRASRAVTSLPPEGAAAVTVPTPKLAPPVPEPASHGWIRSLASAGYLAALSAVCDNAKDPREERLRITQANQALRLRMIQEQLDAELIPDVPGARYVRNVERIGNETRTTVCAYMPEDIKACVMLGTGGDAVFLGSLPGVAMMVQAPTGEPLSQVLGAIQEYFED